MAHPKKKAVFVAAPEQLAQIHAVVRSGRYRSASEFLNEQYPKVMVVQETSVKRLGGPYDWEVSLPRRTAGLDRASTVKCSEICTLWKEQLQGPAGTVPRAIMRQVDRALAIALSLPVSGLEP